MSIEKILFVDEEASIATFLSEAFRKKHIEITPAENGKKALLLFKEQPFDMVILNMQLKDMTGIELLCKMKDIHPRTFFVVTTAFGSVENAVEAMHHGAFHYLIKPYSPDTIEAILVKAKEHLSLVEENLYLRQQVSKGEGTNFHKIVGESPTMKQVLSDVANVAKSHASVFINGESGTGKEVIAHAIHFQSPRSSKPYIKVNCAAVPDTLIESEFFGHEKGAFTGANAKRLGRFELANTGTLLLDEITEVPISLQAKLLRVIQEEEFERVGGSKPVQVDVRLISTSNRDIKQAILDKVLREDLYYRLNVVPINLPPLRARKEDILPLAQYFFDRLCQENHKSMKGFDEKAKQALLNHSWPGNIRELANMIERAVVMSDSPYISKELLYIDEKPPLLTSSSVTIMSIEEMEKKLILETLLAKKNNKQETALSLGISTKTLRNKLNLFGIQ